MPGLSIGTNGAMSEEEWEEEERQTTGAMSEEEEAELIGAMAEREEQDGTVGAMSEEEEGVGEKEEVEQRLCLSIGTIGAMSEEEEAEEEKEEVEEEKETEAEQRRGLSIGTFGATSCEAEEAEQETELSEGVRVPGAEVFPREPVPVPPSKPGVTLNKARVLYLVRVSVISVKSMYKIGRGRKGRRSKNCILVNYRCLCTKLIEWGKVVYFDGPAKHAHYKHCY